MKFLFEVHIKPGYSADEYAAAWVRASEIIQQARGARGTRLHRKIGDPDVLLAIASWESKEDRDAMEARRDEQLKAIVDSQAPNIEFKLIGEFEDAEWVVNPS